MKPGHSPGNWRRPGIQLQVRVCRRMLSATPASRGQAAGSTQSANAYTSCSPIALTPVPSPFRISTRCAASFTRWPQRCWQPLDGDSLDLAKQNTDRGTRLAWLRDFLSLERNVTVASGAVFLLGFGEELWKKFLPKYLETLGASTPMIGLFGTAEDFFDAVYQYPGGWIADRFGRRRAFFFFLSSACAGYVVYLFGPSWPFAFLGLALVMGWQSMASPAIFAVIGDSLPKERRAMGFTIQSILKRVPVMIAPVVGGILIASRGVVSGVHLGLMITLALVALTALLIRFINIARLPHQPTNIFGVWNSFQSGLKRLLISDIFIRTCEGMADVFIILYVTNVLHVSLARFGTLIAISTVTTLVIYLPPPKAADRLGRRPFIIATFCAFALYPLAIVSAHGFGGLVLAFIIGVLKTIAEPPRKTKISPFS